MQYFDALDDQKKLKVLNSLIEAQIKDVELEHLCLVGSELKEDQEMIKNFTESYQESKAMLQKFLALRDGILEGLRNQDALVHANVHCVTGEG